MREEIVFLHKQISLKTFKICKLIDRVAFRNIGFAYVALFPRLFVAYVSLEFSLFFPYFTCFFGTFLVLLVLLLVYECYYSSILLVMT